MTSEGVSDQEDFENAFRVFISSLQVLSHDAVAQCEEMGNYNTPREIQFDVAEGGLALPRSPACYLTHEQTGKIGELAAALKTLPKEAIATPYLKTTSHSGCITAMNHPAWAPIRRDAARLLQMLEPTAKRNEAYFHSQPSS